MKNIEIEKQIRIKNDRNTIRLLSYELGIKTDCKFAIDCTALEQEKLLSACLADLKNEKEKRLIDYEELLAKEKQLCTQLGLRKTTILLSTSIASKIECLKKCVNELEMLKVARIRQMIEFKNEIIDLYRILDMKKFDIFIENLVTKQEDELNLTENDLKRALQIRDDLKGKYSELMNEIKCLANRIKYLWSQLDIKNQAVADLISNCQEFDLKLEKLNKNEVLVMVCIIIAFARGC